MLMLDAPFLTIPGAMRNPSTFPVPMHYRTVAGATGARVVGPDYPAVADDYAATARDLAAAGAGFLTSNCGFAIVYQEGVQSTTDLPTALSSLLLLPLLARVYAGGLGVLTYDAAQLDEARRAAAGWPNDVEVPVADVRHSKAWRALGGGTERLDVEAMRQDLIQTVKALMERHSLRALLLECTGFSPFIADIRAISRIPTFDIVGLVRFLMTPEAWSHEANDTLPAEGGGRSPLLHLTGGDSSS
jgi:hypothetical protein